MRRPKETDRPLVPDSTEPRPERGRRLRPRIPRGRGVQAALALFVYVGLSTLFLAPPVIGHFGSSYAAYGGIDSRLFTWSLVWWPHALSHGINPFVTHVVWAPSGFNLAWATTIPALALLASPLTLTVGAVAAYNTLVIVALALAAWAAFLLCRYITGSFWASLAGGYVFGFSTYQLSHADGHLNLAFDFAVPLVVYLVVRMARRDFGRFRFVVLLTLTLLFQFMVSTEIFLTMTLFGGLALAVAWALAGGELRGSLARTSGLTLVAYALTALAAAPYLYYALRGAPSHPLLPPDVYSADLLNFVVPTKVTLLGHGLAEGISSRFTGSAAGQSAYMGLPLLLVAGHFAVTRWRTLAGKLLTIGFLVAAVCSLGPVLHVGGSSSIGLPWQLAVGVPILQVAIPGRLVLYAFLALALMVALWLRVDGGSRTRWITVLVALAFLVPNAGFLRASEVRIPRFISSGDYQRYLEPGETVVVLPYRGLLGMQWQSETQMYFRMAGGYLGRVPARFESLPIVHKLRERTIKPGDAPELARFLEEHRVRAILLPVHSAPRWRGVLAPLGAAHRVVEGVLVYDLNHGQLRAVAQEGGA